MTADAPANRFDALCCFCAKTLASTDPDAFQVTLSKRGLNGSQTWLAHEACLAASLDPRAQFERDIYWRSE